MGMSDLVVEGPVPGAHDLVGIPAELDTIAQSFGDGNVVGVYHARHAGAHGPQVAKLAGEEHLRRKGAVTGGKPLGNAELGMGLEHVVLLDEGFLGQLPVDRQPTRVPPLGPHRLHFPSVQNRGDGLQ